ncbi:MAG: response regulator transcription factor [Deferribacteraceae bacterium]|nr:response regulator transcription factor [Deferribacteraceae bacterium]
MNNILIIEDENDLRDIIQYNLKQNGYTVISLSNANDALIVMEDTHTDLILLDLMLPGLQGLQFLDIIRKRKDSVHIIIISARNAEHDIINALERGADDYITKPFSFDFLEAKIQAVLRRGVSSAAKTDSKNRNGIVINDEIHKVTIDGEQIHLTQKEYNLLSLFLRNPEKVFTRNRLLNSVWGYDSELYTRTVDSHVATLRKKLGEKGKHIRSIPKIGYSWESNR